MARSRLLGRYGKARSSGAPTAHDGPGGCGLHPDQLPGPGLSILTSLTDTYVPWDVHQPRGKRPWCASCDTDLHLVAEFPAVRGRQSGTLAVAVRCSQCRFSRVVDTTADHVAALPGLSFEPRTEQRNTQDMTFINNTTGSKTTLNGGHMHLASLEDLDLTPAGLADAPAREEDRESIVHTGNS